MKLLRRKFLRLAAATAALPVVSRSARAQANPREPVTAPIAGERLTIDNLYERVHESFADHDGVKIHYVAIGEGPLVLFIHGFPDQWFTWRHQMVALADNYKVVRCLSGATTKATSQKVSRITTSSF
jgi:hypothetical protein